MIGISVPCSEEQQIPGTIDPLHRVMIAAPIRVVLRRKAFPSLVDPQGGEPPRQGKVQALAGDDRLEVGMLAEGPPVMGTQGWAAFAAAAMSGAAGGLLPAALTTAFRSDC